MTTEHNLEAIKAIIVQFFKKMTVNVKIDDLTINEGAINVLLVIDEPHVLIGENGQTLNDLQQILRLILRRHLEDNSFRLDIDINGYKKEKADKIREIVREAIDEVIITGKEKTLPPMTASDRRIVHVEISLRTDVKSESVGEEPERRVVIMPI